MEVGVFRSAFLPRSGILEDTLRTSSSSQGPSNRGPFLPRTGKPTDADLSPQSSNVEFPLSVTAVGTSRRDSLCHCPAFGYNETKVEFETARHQHAHVTLQKSKMHLATWWECDDKLFITLRASQLKIPPCLERLNEVWQCTSTGLQDGCCYRSATNRIDAHHAHNVGA